MVSKRRLPRLPRGLSVNTTWLGALGLSCLSLACARTSEERVVAIARLLEEARSFQAEQYAPKALAQAEDLLHRTRTELAEQKERPWFLSRHRRARELLQESETAASLVRAEAAAAVVRIRQGAAKDLTDAHAALHRASEAYWRSPRGKDTRTDLLRMRSDLDALLRSLNEAELALEQGDYLVTSRLAADVERRAGTVARTIDRATAYRIGETAASRDVNPDVSYPPFRAPAAPLLEASQRSEGAARPGRRAG